MRFVSVPFMRVEKVTTILGVAALVASLADAGCGDSSNTGSGGNGNGGSQSTNSGANGGNGPGSGGSTSQGFGGGLGGSPAQCVNLECQQVDCQGNTTTTVSGTVYTPAGNLPLYNVVVYVPNAPVEPLTDGATCDQCASMLSGSPLVSALTDTSGHFTLENVPVGDNIPLVIQIGKWRRETTIPTVAECADTPLTDVEQTSLPSNQGEGHIPKIALTTGGADPLECLLRKVGIEDSEFTPETGTGRVNLFTGSGGSQRYANSLNGGANLTNAQNFWSAPSVLNSYDIVLLACEGDQNPGTKPAGALQALHDYTSIRGRVFASHWHNYWLQAGPADFQSVTSWNFGNPNPPDPFSTTIDTSFPKGMALSEWLFNVGASNPQGSLIINEPRHTAATINPAVAQQWIYATIRRRTRRTRRST